MTDEEYWASLTASERLEAELRLRRHSFGEHAGLLDEVVAECKRSRAVVEAAREVVCLYSGPANYPLIAKLQQALESLDARNGKVDGDG